MASIHDVAQQAGVSYTTVSKVLNRRPGDRTSPETRLRVIQAAQNLNYQPNAVARSLRSRRTDIIGFYTSDLVDDFSNPFISALLNGLQRGCQEHNKDVLIHRNFQGRSTDEVYADLVNGKVDGLVLPYGCDDFVVERLTRAKLPAVAVADRDSKLPSVFVDAPAGFRLLARHLAECGHRRVLYHDNERSMNAGVNVRRWAFQEEAEGLGMTVSVGIGGPDGEVSGGEATLLLGPPSTRPTAVVCWNDHYAHRVMAFCRDQGLRVPQDVAVAGFDGFSTTISLPYRLTTVAAPWAECAHTAVALIVALREGQSVPAETMLPVALIPGDTT